MLPDHPRSNPDYRIVADDKIITDATVSGPVSRIKKIRLSIQGFG